LIVCTNQLLRAERYLSALGIGTVPDGSSCQLKAKLKLPRNGFNDSNEPIFLVLPRAFFTHLYGRTISTTIYSSAIAGANDVCGSGSRLAHEKMIQQL